MSIQERIEQMANVSEAPTREEHNERQDYYTRLFNDPAVSNYVDAVERDSDRIKQELAEVNEKIEEQIKKNNADISQWLAMLRDPNVKNDEREQMIREIERLRQENDNLKKLINND